MCWIGNIECKGCSVEIEMHLGDFNTQPEEVEVYCENCVYSGVNLSMPQDDFWKAVCRRDSLLEQGVFWADGHGEDGALVIPKTENALRNADDNTPNGGSGLAAVVFGKPQHQWVADEIKEKLKKGAAG